MPRFNRLLQTLPSIARQGNDPQIVGQLAGELKETEQHFNLAQLWGSIDRHRASIPEMNSMFSTLKQGISGKRPGRGRLLPPPHSILLTKALSVLRAPGGHFFCRRKVRFAPPSPPFSTHAVEPVNCRSAKGQPGQPFHLNFCSSRGI
jgi:hypothetical protein